MNTALKAFVAIFSFAFTFIGASFLLLILVTPFLGMLTKSHHPLLAGILSFTPYIISLPAAIQTAKVSIRSETDRQNRRSAKILNSEQV